MKNAYETMRETLVEISNLADAMLGKGQDANAIAILDKCRAALAAPARNCDVGTAEEQEKRFIRFCNTYGDYDCRDCPLIGDKASCPLGWAQMPYEEGEEGK